MVRQIISTIIRLWWLLFKTFVFAVKKRIGPSLWRNRSARVPWLDANFAPVHKEVSVDNLEVIEGAIPHDLDGQYIRNGPNPRWKPNGPHHWFDGDGMLHGTRICNGIASYSNKWVRTVRFLEEEDHHGPLHTSLAEVITPEGMVLMFFRMAFNRLFGKRLNGRGTSNTNLVYHTRRLLSLVESDAPYEVTAPSLNTVGRYDFNNKLDGPFTAHPKIDAKTGEMMCFGYRFDHRPYCSYYVVTKTGQLLDPVPIDIPVATMMHDFAITEHFSIILDLPLTFRIERILFNKPVIMFEPDRPSSFGILPRHSHSGNDVRWFGAAPCYMFHTANAWEVKEEVHLVGCRSAEVHRSLFSSEGHAKGAPQQYDSKTQPRLYKWTFNLRTGATTEIQLCDLPCEFPRIREELTGYPAQYLYLSIMEQNPENPHVPRFEGFLKFDLFSEREVARVSFGAHRFGGEPVFVPRSSNSSEDDGYLMTYIHDETLDTSSLFIVDAMTLSSLAVVRLPQRIPYGFHGLWLTEKQIKEQLMS